MNREQVLRLSPEQRALVGVAYLMDKKELRPESCKAFFDKLEKYDAAATSINVEMKKAQKFIVDSKTKLNQLIGSINALSEVIAEALPKENLEAWCLDFNMPDGLNNIAEISPEPDLAGSTATKMPPIDINALGKGK